MQNSVELLSELNRFARANVLVIGDVMLDTYWMGTASRLSPEAPVPVVDLKKSRDIPGGAANVAANIRGLGSTVTLASVIGADSAGRRLCSELENAGVCSDYLIRSDDRATTTKTRVLVHKQQVVRIDDETNEYLSEADARRLISLVTDLISKSDALVLSDYAKGCLTAEVISTLTTESRKHGKPVIVDPKSRDFTKYNGASVLTPNLSEAMHAAHMEYTGAASVDKAAEKLLSEAEVDCLLITLGEHGMKLFRRGEEPIHVESVARQVFDVTGAGDTVVASLASGLAANAGWSTTMQIANVAAGLAVEKVGTSTVSVEEIRAAISNGY